MVPKLSLSDEELIDACLQNNQLAQKALYDRYKKAMFTLAYRIVGDFDYASDVLQDAFVRIFMHLHTFRKESTLGAWIKTIVIRTAYGHLRKQKLRFEPLENVQEEAITHWPDFLQAEHLERAILQLPNGYRMVFILAEVEGYPHKDIATLLNISEGTSKSQLFHAKKTLRKMLDE